MCSLCSYLGSERIFQKESERTGHGWSSHTNKSCLKIMVRVTFPGISRGERTVVPFLLCSVASSMPVNFCFPNGQPPNIVILGVLPLPCGQWLLQQRICSPVKRVHDSSNSTYFPAHYSRIMCSPPDLLSQIISSRNAASFNYLEPTGRRGGEGKPVVQRLRCSSGLLNVISECMVMLLLI